MKINLDEIPSEGRQYEFSRKDGRLNQVLEDLVSDRSYEVDLFLKPFPGGFEVRGKTRGRRTDVCSKCGWDLEIPIEHKVNELLIYDKERPRNSHGVHGNQSSDFSGSGPETTYISGPTFDLGEYVHELMAFSIPDYPVCPDSSCSEHLREFQSKLKSVSDHSNESADIQGHPAFQVLSQLKNKEKPAKKEKL